jgi:hypothetical protein
MALALDLNNSFTQNGIEIPGDRLFTINPTGTILIYDNNNNLLATFYGSDPEISQQEG